MEFKRINGKIYTTGLISVGGVIMDKFKIVYQNEKVQREGDFVLCKIDDELCRVLVLEHGKEYIIETKFGKTIGLFDAGHFAFSYHSGALALHLCSGFAPIPELINI